jgi:hypothetical protein
MVQAPAIALLINNIVFLVMGVGLFFAAPQITKGLMQKVQEMQAQSGQPVTPVPEDLKQTPLDYAQLALKIVVGGLSIFGAVQMRNLQSYGMAMTGSILSMIPCLAPCCISGLPLGIWAIIVLNKPEVKSAFR